MPKNPDQALKKAMITFIREKYGHRLPVQRPPDSEVEAIAKQVAEDMTKLMGSALFTFVGDKVRSSRGH